MTATMTLTLTEMTALMMALEMQERFFGDLQRTADLEFTRSLRARLADTMAERLNRRQD